MLAHSEVPSWQLVDVQVNSQARLDRAGHTATVVGNEICIAGGRRGSAFYNDVLLIDISTGKLSAGKPVIKFPEGLRPRAHHSATLIGNHIWFIGGGDDDVVFGDVFTLDITLGAWKVVSVTDPGKLLQRTAHTADVHPHLPSVILLSGGYAPLDCTATQFDMVNDVVMFDTQSCSTERMVPRSGSVIPPGRAYHSMSILGDRLYVFGGRRYKDASVGQDKHNTELLDGKHLLSVYDVRLNKWLAVTPAGTTPSARSSHRAVPYHNRIVIYGGAAAAGSQAPKQRLTDVHSLVVLPDGQLLWSNCDSPAHCDNMPHGRSAHSLSLIGSTLYVMCGYNGTSTTRGQYAKDCWALRLLPDAFERSQGIQQAVHTAAGRSGRGQAAGCVAAAAAAGKGHPRHKRHTMSAATPAGVAAAAAAPGAPEAAGTSGRCVPAAVKAAGGASGGAAGDAASWRTVKRQRSGGKDRQQQQQQAAQQQQPAQADCQQQGCLHRTDGMQQQHQQQQAQALQQHQQQRDAAQQQMQRQLADQDGSFTNAVVHALGQLVVVGAPGSGSPLRAGSPLRDSFGNSMYLQQEVESLRGQLQDSIRQCSSLEAEVRLLKQQAAEAKVDARQDKQHLEQKLHEQQVEAARQRTLAEQANVRQQRALEEVAVAQQDLSAAKQQLQKSDLEREAAQLQLQGLHAELRKLRATHTEADQELRQLQLQVQQQQQQERRLQEQLTAERQQRQEEATATRASIEQHRIELRRLNDTMGDQKQKYDAALLQQQQTATAQQQQLQEATQQLHDVQRQLAEAQAALSDARRQRDDAVQMQQSVQEQFGVLHTTHKTTLLENSRLEAAMSNLKDEQEHTKRELEQRRAAAVNLQAAIQQMQTAAQAVANASLHWDR